MRLPGLRIGRLRRFTRNRVLPVDIGRRRLLFKYLPNAGEAVEEVRGHAALAPHYRVPRLYFRIRVPGGALLGYERLPGGRDRGLLLDLLNRDGETGTRLLDEYLDELTRSYRTVMRATCEQVPPGEVIGKLYRDRALPGGRLDDYYANVDFPLTDAPSGPRIRDLARHGITVNGVHHPLDWSKTLSWLREEFQRPEPVWSAISQGDPTDVNLAVPLAWFDHDTGGRNAIAGEFANFCWYTCVLGGWLVPTYNPGAFTNHPAVFDRIVDNSPRIRVGSTDRHNGITVDIDDHLSPARHRAVSSYWHRLVVPTAAELFPRRDIGEVLRPYLAMRIIGVYNLADLAADHRLYLLARLAQCMAPHFDPAAFFAVEEETWQPR